MTAYRVLTFGDDRVVMRVNVIEARTDAAALTAAEQLLKDHDLEVWTGTRRVGAFSATARLTDPRGPG
jgi:hypothetical protein